MIDATGKYVFPGFIDPHVHIYLPFMGTFAKDTHETASRAALVGGTTTFIEMICPGRDEKPLEAFELWLGKAQGASACDFTFHMGVTRFDDEAERDFREIVRRGISSFKIFLAYKGAFGVNDEELYKTLALAKELGVITTAHCENADLVAELQKKLLAEGKTGPEWHYWSRPPVVEAEGVHHLMTFAEMTGAHVYIVHPSCEESLGEANRGRGARRARLGRNADSISAARSHRRGEAELRRREVRHVAAAARQEKSGSALERLAATASSPRSRPITRRSISRPKKPWATMISPRSPTAFRRSRTGSIFTTPTA